MKTKAQKVAKLADMRAWRAANGERISLKRNLWRLDDDRT